MLGAVSSDAILVELSVFAIYMAYLSEFSKSKVLSALSLSPVCGVEESYEAQCEETCGSDKHSAGPSSLTAAHLEDSC